EKGHSGVPHEPETRKIWTNASDAYTPYVRSDYGRAIRFDTTSFTGTKVSLWRWRDDFQNDFAARMDWCQVSYEQANHPPVTVSNQPQRITVKSGQGFSLDASGSFDPDGDNLSFLWFHYPEAGSYRKPIHVGTENLKAHWVTAPEVTKEETAHFILRVTDKGTPSLSRYQRIIVTILPK